MNARIRKALDQDAEQIAFIAVDSWQKAYKGIFPDSYLDKLSVSTRTDWAKRMLVRDDCCFFVAVPVDDSKKVLGYVLAGKCTEKNSEGDAEIWALYINLQFQGKGLGKKLFDAAFDYLRSQRYRKVLISAIEGNELGQKFYLRQGARIGPDDSYVLEGVRYTTKSFLWDL